MTRANEENSVASRDSQSLLHLRITWEDVKSPGVHVWTKYVNVFTGETQASGCFTQSLSPVSHKAANSAISGSLQNWPPGMCFLWSVHSLGLIFIECVWRGCG